MHRETSLYRQIACCRRVRKANIDTLHRVHELNRRFAVESPAGGCYTLGWEETARLSQHCGVKGIESMATVRIIYDNVSFLPALEADWGFATLIEAHQKTILFDTGSNGRILLENMRILEIDPQSISDVFVSHSHFDHVGGLSHFLNENNSVTLHAPTSFRGVRSAERVVYYDRPKEIYPGLYTTGELDGIEQSLAIQSETGFVLIVGCSHPSMDSIVSSVESFGPVHGIIGGLHGFDRLELFSGFGLICPAHCTKHTDRIRERFPGAFIPAGAGKVIQF
jgi:7,8-dihydropterin-6-yl-methyl-4-(beta-D-ribofuranosyl)aminobenzene 5'-phosphate synthase